jgi:outer membrane scaffolding protein for murein synthesis (MipA/OmpV family)
MRTPSNMRTPAAVAAALCALGAAGLAHGQATERPKWELGAGVFGFYLPDYRGSDEYGAYAFPFPYVRYRGDWLRMDDRRGIAALLLLDTDRVELDVSLNASQPARSQDNAARQGMPDLAGTVEIGPVAKIDLWRSASRANELSLQIPVRAALAFPTWTPDYIGIVVNPVIDFFMRDAGPGGGWRFGVQAGPLFNDQRYNQYYYQVDPQYATAARPAYDASGGYGGTQFTLSLNKRFDRIWVGGFVRAYDLHGAVFEDSPLVKSRTAFLAGLGIAYVFAESSDRVTAED